MQGNLKIGVYTSFSLYMSKLLSTTQALGSIDITIKPVCISLGRIKEILSLNGENLESSQNVEVPINSIEFRDVGFRYNTDSKYIVKHLNAELVIGDKVLINGVNGAGKTTLIKLLTGLYTPIEGKILINDIDYSLLNKGSIRERIGIVSQNIFLFKGTVLDNILYGQKDKTRENAMSIIKKYHLEKILDELDKGLDTEIVQDGSSISGGQAQFIAFIRAVIKKRDIIILDEATSNLHAFTRDIIYNILQNYDVCNILIMISHQNEELHFINKVIEL
ncbi:ABC transporter ATP-binding protein [Rummeliibacillus suwonensis]|uniref:ABC transporter ATP-binding protein n=1 Tax=Rummeliibacillus suwonensis TaxID=1306154 RepID=UPI0028A0D9FF|nr:ABC transporter ATP-binding protein [Rummeliibacillus suwonensis]